MLMPDKKIRWKTVPGHTEWKGYLNGAHVATIKQVKFCWGVWVRTVNPHGEPGMLLDSGLASSEDRNPREVLAQLKETAQVCYYARKEADTAVYGANPVC